jgi:hypothetical protein
MTSGETTIPIPYLGLWVQSVPSAQQKPSHLPLLAAEIVVLSALAPLWINSTSFSSTTRVSAKSLMTPYTFRAGADCSFPYTLRRLFECISR